uniref:CUB domain-containing protein n=1 Tax=Macrostomum lignano TaxID=282301 RepID=A0A1I8IHF6_9PLAT
MVVRSAFVCLVILSLSIVTMTTAASACGGYREGLNTGQSFTLTSPNYPSNYDRNQRCIWLFAAKNGTGFRINVTSVSLEGTGNNSTGCRDYLQITDGSSVATELAYLCQVSSPLLLTANRVYLWVKFQSNHQIQGAGFQMTVTTVTDITSVSNSTPVKSCKNRYTCPNKECVYQGSLCDNINDCGCDDYGCDETKCWKFEFLNDPSVVWGLGMGIGLTLSIAVFIICGFVEMPERKRPECMRRREHQPGGCLGRCGAKNKGGRRFGRVHHSKQQSRRRLRRSSVSVGSALGSRRSSVYAPTYGNTLSPNYSAPRPAASPTTAAANAAPQTEQKPPGPVTLAVPKVSST